MAEDWDLFAIVRSCQAATFTATSTETPPTTTNTRSPQDTTSCLATFTVNKENNGPFSFPNLVQPRTNGFQELHQLFMTFNPTTTTTTTTTTSTSGRGINPNSPFSDFAGSIGQRQQYHNHPVLPPTSYTSTGRPHFMPEASTSGFDRFHDQQKHVQQPQHPQQQQQQQQHHHNQLQVQVPQRSSAIVLPNTQSQTPRSRKRKSQQKKMVCHVTADNLSADLWAWRKYGQKPIKGSPYPRNYYRCSSCKGCAARKQVERSNTEPNMFIVTYTGDHKHAKPSHRNSLAGSTRNKPSAATHQPATHEPGSPSNVASTSISVVSPTTPLAAPPEKDDSVDDPLAAVETDGADRETDFDMASDDDDILIPNAAAAISDDIFLGLHHFGGGGHGGEEGHDGGVRISILCGDASSPSSAPGLTPVCSEPPSNNSWPNPC